MSVHTTGLNQRIETAEKICLERGRRLTPIRKHVLEHIVRHGRSIKAYELLDLMRTTHKHCTPATIYRALDFLVAEGLVHRLDAINAWSACHDVGGNPHDWLVICTECGAVAEISAPDLSQQLAFAIQKTGFSVSSHETEIRGMCPDCHTSCPERPSML